MAIRGRDLVAQIEALVKADSRAKHQSLRQAFAMKIEMNIPESELTLRAIAFFDAIRNSATHRAHIAGANTARREWADPPSLRPTEDVVSRSTGATELPLPAPSHLTELWPNWVEEYRLLQTELNVSRGKASHVLAVLRPFQAKYLGEWEPFIGPAHKVERIRKQVSELQRELIEDRDELEDWLDSAYDLFADAAVRQASENAAELVARDSERSRRSLAPGMISEPSERIYRQQWRLWTRENLTRLLEVVTNSEPQPEASQALEDFRNPQLMYVSSDAANKSLEGMTTHPEALSFDVHSQGLKASSAQHQAQIPPSHNHDSPHIVLSVSPDTDPSLIAKRSWLSIDGAAAETASWLEILDSSWELDGAHMRLTLTIVNTSQPTEITFRPASALDLARVAMRYLASTGLAPKG